MYHCVEIYNNRAKKEWAESHDHIGVGGFIPDNGGNVIDEYEIAYGSKRTEDITRVELEKMIDYDKLIDVKFADIVTDLNTMSLEDIDAKYYTIYRTNFFESPENQDKYAKYRVVSLENDVCKRVVDTISTTMRIKGSINNANWWSYVIDLSDGKYS